MERILISACLVGDKCKYNGQSNYTPLVKELLEKYELIPFCPEVEGGLPIPRHCSERREDKVFDDRNKDVTKYFHLGAEKAYNICMYLGIKIAILKDKSPSCGSKTIYDGTFTHKEIEGQGYTAQYLSSRGITVLSEDDISSLL